MPPFWQSPQAVWWRCHGVIDSLIDQRGLTAQSKGTIYIAIAPLIFNPAPGTMTDPFSIHTSSRPAHKGVRQMRLISNSVPSLTLRIYYDLLESCISIQLVLFHMSKTGFCIMCFIKNNHTTHRSSLHKCAISMSFDINALAHTIYSRDLSLIRVTDLLQIDDGVHFRKI